MQKVMYLSDEEGYDSDDEDLIRVVKDTLLASDVFDNKLKNEIKNDVAIMLKNEDLRGYYGRSRKGDARPDEEVYERVMEYIDLWRDAGKKE